MRRIQLSDHFTIPLLLRFALPSIGMQLVDNSYQVADGFFISNYIGETAFEAENLIFPPLFVVMAVGLMFGTGASALIARDLGEGRKEQASRILSQAMAVLALLSVILSAALYFLLPSITVWIGADAEMAPDCIVYGRMLSFFMPFQMLSMAFHPLLITAERPGLGLAATVVNAAANILLDWLFMAVFGWGLQGAALATGLAWMASAVIPLFYFMNKKNPLHFTAPSRDLRPLGRTVHNGASEMADAVSYAAVAVIFNLQLLRWMGNDGVGAYAVSEYVSGLYVAIFYGISMSMVPVVGYRLGKKDVPALRSLRRTAFTLMGLLGLGLAALSFSLAYPLSRIFVGYSEDLTAKSVEALEIISLSYIVGGITTCSSSYFTGLNQGTASLVIASVKGFFGPLVCIFLLPPLLGSSGLWYATPAAEILTLLTAVPFFLHWKKREASGDLPEPDEDA